MTAHDFASRLTERIADVTGNAPVWTERELDAGDLVAIARETMLLIRSICPHTDLLRVEYHADFFCHTCQQWLKEEDLLTAFAAQGGSGRPTLEAETGPAASLDDEAYGPAGECEGDVSEESRAMMQAEHMQHFRN